jgi:hypothetical protein
MLEIERRLKSGSLEGEGYKTQGADGLFPLGLVNSKCLFCSQELKGKHKHRSKCAVQRSPPGRLTDRTRSTRERDQGRDRARQPSPHPPGYSHLLTSLKKKQDYDLLFPKVPKLLFDDAGNLRNTTATTQPSHLVDPRHQRSRDHGPLTARDKLQTDST